MSTPLVAGGISALLHAKPYASQEMLWGDLINSAGNHVNFKACYDAGEAPAQLQFETFEMNDTIAGDGDYRPDAGETIYLYPTLRTTWGATDNIMMWLTVDEFENPDIVTFLDADPVAFGQSLSAYAKSKSANPLRFSIDPDCVDGRYINLELHATSSNAQSELVFPFTIQVENGVELSGMIIEDLSLYPNVHYIVTSTIAVPSGVTLTIKPGTTLKFHDYTGISCSGNIHCVGTPDSLIRFIPAEGQIGYSIGFHFPSDTIKYTMIDGFVYYNYSYDGLMKGRFVDCIITNNQDRAALGMYPYIFGSYVYFIHSNTLNNFIHCGWGSGHVISSNVIGNYGNYLYSNNPSNFAIRDFRDCNLLDYKYYGSNDQYNGKNVYWGSLTTTPAIIHTDNPSYFGSSLESIVRQGVWDIHQGVGFEEYDLSNMRTFPNPETHGIVWKVVVNGYDAQDEFEQLPPLGCGRHEFKVYFNRPMDTSVTPMITMGVRSPYTQHAIAENGSWNAEGTIYTAYLTIDGTTATDGLNRIYVAEAKDNEHFEIPVENFRFNVQVASAGSLSNEFMATPGLGKVELEWSNNEVDFEDFLGYNMYRYTIVDTLGHHSDTLMLNTSLIQDTLFTDYNVEPGIRYYYYYKVLRTNLIESEASLIVTTVPLTSIPGDANGSMGVDVADVVSLVSYLTNGNPQPFIFEAADVNGDGTIDILDVVGIINLIINRGELPDKDPVATAYYSIENGFLFVDTPVELGGVQFVFDNAESLEVLQALEGFEQVTAETSNGTLFMAYSMSGKKLPAGKHALLRIGEASINTIALSDPEGRNVMAILSGAGVEEHETLFLEQPYPNPFNGNLTIPFIIGDDKADHVVLSITNVMGQTVSVINLGSRSRGEYQYEWKPEASMAPGIYTVSMQVNGRMVQHAKVVYVK
jgi:hypothetical protein